MEYDHNLSFPDFLYAKCNFLVHIQCSRWSAVAVNAFNWLLYNLDPCAEAV
ncbi:hypothetical protein ID866_10540 [Astraeus odoratus]|nr:hypothetical protein ID866_10540 [Astraeus odoratus]